MTSDYTPKSASKSALITGANGFVGRALCNEMLRKGWQVRAVVRSSSKMQDSVEAVVMGDIGADTDWTSALHPQGVGRGCKADESATTTHRRKGLFIRCNALRLLHPTRTFYNQRLIVKRGGLECRRAQ